MYTFFLHSESKYLIPNIYNGPESSAADLTDIETAWENEYGTNQHGIAS